MGILSKAIVLYCFLPVLLFGASYIQEVDVSKVEDPWVRSELVDRFKGAVVEPEQIQSYLNRIYLRGKYKSVDYAINLLGSNYQLSFVIVQNPVVKDIVFSSDNMDGYFVRRMMKTKIGKPFNYNTISDDVEFINNYLLLKGYFLESVRDISIDDDGILHVNIESPRLRNIRLIGLERTKSFVIYRELTLRKGDRVNSRFLNIDSDTLSSLPYFSSVSSPVVNFISSENVMISYQFNERKINRFDFGLEELENDQGVALFSKFKLYHAFIYSDFIMLQAQLGYLNEFNLRTYQIHYQQPWLFNRYNFIFDLNAYTSYRSELYQGETTTYDTIRSGTSVYLTKPVKRYFLLAGAGVKFESVYPQSTGTFSSYYLNSMSLYVEFDRVSSILNPKDGYRTRFTVDRGGRVFGVNLGGVDFSRFSVRHSQYILLSQQFIFAYRAFGGYYDKISNQSTFETEKFSLGGSNSLRGYQEFSFYGDYRLSLNVEPRYQFNDQLMGVVFLDVGYISDALDAEIGDFIHYGYGAGVRFLNSFLPLRFDLAYGNDLILHFNVSQTF